MKTLKKAFGPILFLMLLCLFCTSVAIAADAPYVIPLDTETTQALLFTCDDEHYVIGGSNYEAICQALKKHNISSLSAVIAPCTHEEHVVSAQQVADHFMTELLTRPNPLLTENVQLNWLENGLNLTIGDSVFTFGVNEPSDNSVCYRCDGQLIAYSATTSQTSVNVREKTSTQAKRVGKLTRGSLVTVLKPVLNDANELWYQVVTEDGIEGYIRSDLLQFVSETAKEELAAEQEATKKETRYIGHKKNKVFHKPSCSSLPAGKNRVYFDSRSYAVSKGYRPCSKCDP